MSEQTKAPEEDLDEEVHDACGQIAADINNAGEEAQREFLKVGLPLPAENSHELLIAIAYLEKGYNQVAQVIRNLRGIDELPTKVSQDAAHLIAEQFGTVTGRWHASKPNLSNPPRHAVTADFAEHELRVMAKAIADLGVSEWFHELMDMVCFPDVDDALHLRDTIKEHLNDDRVKFLHEGEAPPRGDSGAPQDDDTRRVAGDQALPQERRRGRDHHGSNR